jgi:hypothetical protein
MAETSTVDGFWAGRRAWRQLPRATRRAIRRYIDRDEGEAELAHIRIAYDWSRAARRAQLRALVTFLVLSVGGFTTLGLILAEKGPLWQPSSGLLLSVLVAPAAVLVVPTYLLWPAARRLPATLGLLAYDAPASPPQPQTLLARDRRRENVGMGATALLLVAGIVWLPSVDLRVGELAVSVVAVPFLLYAVLLGDDGVAVRPRRGRPVLMLDDDGMTIAYLGLHLQWTEITTVSTRPDGKPAAASWFDPPVVKLYFGLEDLSAVRQRARPANWRYRLSLRRMLRNDSALAFHARWFADDPELILCAALDFMAVAQAELVEDGVG